MDKDETLPPFGMSEVSFPPTKGKCTLFQELSMRQQASIKSSKNKRKYPTESGGVNIFFFFKKGKKLEVLFVLNTKVINLV